MGACGVCHSDLSAINGTIALPLPLVLGHEAAGVVEEVGEGVSGIDKGDHVVFSFIYMCGKCRFCVSGRPVLCLEQGKALTTPLEGTPRVHDAAGKPLGIFSGCGTMAEYATVSAENLIRIDPKIPMEVAALVGCAAGRVSVSAGSRAAGHAGARAARDRPPRRVSERARRDAVRALPRQRLRPPAQRRRSSKLRPRPLLLRKPPPLRRPRLLPQMALRLRVPQLRPSRARRIGRRRMSASVRAHRVPAATGAGSSSRQSRNRTSGPSSPRRSSCWHHLPR